MTVTIVGHWELSWNTPIKEAELWAIPMRDFGVYEWRMWPVSGILNQEQQVHLTEYPDLDVALKGLPGRRVFLEADGHFPLATTQLHEYEHPEDAVYIFGSAHFNAALARRTDADDAVQVPTVENAGALWPHQVMVAVLYDRLVKSWR